MSWEEARGRPLQFPTPEARRDTSESGASLGARKEASLVDPAQFKGYFFRVAADALHTDEIDQTRGFYELGGDSFSAAVVIGALMDEFGIELAMEDLFEAESIGGLAETMESALSPV